MEIVGFGTPGYGNNAAITLGMPAGVQTGDLLLVFLQIREDGASLFTLPSGWTYRCQGGYFNGVTETFLEVASATYTGAEGLTFTPNGGGSNDTTLGVILALRGNYEYITWGSGFYNAGTSMYVSPSVGNPSRAYRAGDVAISFHGWADDPAGSFTTGFTGGTFTSASIQLSSILGADAASIVTAHKVLTNTPGYTSFSINCVSPIAGLVALGISVGSALDAVTYTAPTPTGGTKVGGTATSLFEKIGGFIAPTPTGGVKVGGVADAGRYHNITAPTPTGGVKVGGAAFTYYKLNINYLPTGPGLKVGGAAVTSYVHPVPYVVDGMGLAWNAEAVPDDYVSGWVVEVSVGANKFPCTNLTLRRDGTSLQFDATLFANGGTIAKGQTVTTKVIYRIVGAPDVEHVVASATITEAVLRKEFYRISSVATSWVEENGAEWAPEDVLYESDGTVRSTVDWFVRPGNTYKGVTFSEVVTTMGANSYWFTEARGG